MVIDRTRQGRSPAGNEAGQGNADHARQGDDRRIGKQVAQERLNSFGTVWPAQVEQNYPKLHRLSFIRTFRLRVMMKMLFAM